MSPGWWGVVAVVVIGTVVVWYGWWRDRGRARAASELASKPTRTIPGLPERDAPAYVQESEILGTPIDQSATSADADLIARKDAAATLPAGAADGGFFNRADDGLAVLASPDVLVLDADLEVDRDANTLLFAAKRRGRPLVIVAPDFSPAVVGTLRANAVKGLVRTLPIPLMDAAARRKAVALTGGRLVEAGDLASGWLPEESWGTCDGWVADLDDSWVVVAGRDKPIRPEAESRP